MRVAASPLNSHMLLRLLQATELIGRSPIPQAPLEIAIIEVTESHNHESVFGTTWTNWRKCRESSSG
jgi:hypothetical protein